MSDEKDLNKAYEALNKQYQELQAAENELASSYKVLQSAEQELSTQNQELTSLKENLQYREQLLKESQRVARIGHYVFYVELLAWQSSEMLNEIFGIDNTYPCSVEGWLQIIHPDHRQEMKDYLSIHVIQNKQQFDKEYKIIRQNDHQERWVHGMGDLKLNTEGSTAEMFGVIQDITERKLFEQALLESNTRLQLAMEGTNDGIWDVQMSTGSVYLSPRGCEILGYGSDELGEVVKVWSDLVHPDDLELTNQRLQAHINGESPVFEVEQRLRTKSGSWKWILTRGKVVEKSPDGTPVRITGTHTDIDERKQAQLGMSHSYNLLNYIIEHSNSAVAVLDRDIKYVYVSQRYLDEYKIKDKSVIGKSHYDIFPEIPDSWKKIHQRALKGEVISEDEEPFFRIDGTIDWTRWECRPWHEKDGSIGGIILYTEVINERKQAEITLKEAKEKAEEGEETYRMLFESINDAVFISEVISNGYMKFINVNDVACQRLEYTREEFLKLSPFDIHTEESKKNLPGLIFELLEKKRGIFEAEHITKSGKVIPVEISTRITLFKNKTLVHSIARDITERKRSEHELKEKADEIEAQNEEYRQINEELFLAKERAEESDRLKTAFLQNMSHEIRTPMNAIMGFSELLTHNYNNKPKLAHFAEIINHRCNDLLEIINDLLDIAKIESGQQPVNIEVSKVSTLFNDLSEFFEEYMVRQKKQHINLNMHLGEPADLMVLADNCKLKQIFINLIGNAVKFTNEGSIEVSYFVDSSPYVTFYVKDTGIGILKEKQQVIFDRFAQVYNGPQRLYGGTGLGLSIVKGLLTLQGGKIWLESEPGVGSTFYFTIPRSTSASTSNHKTKTEITSPIALHQDKTILVVEDDQFNAEYIKEVLSEIGLKLLFATFGKEAVQIALNQVPDLVLMDISLPDMSGYDAVQKIKEQKPDLKIIAQTAFALDEDKQKAINTGCIDYISKPLKSEALLAMIDKYI